MVIIGITGAIGHGKSTLAEAFGQVEQRSRHLESFQVIAEVVDKWHARTVAVPDPHKLEQVNDWVNLLPDILEEVVREPVDRLLLTIDLSQVTAAPMLYDKLFQHITNLKEHPELLRSRINETNKAGYRPILQWLGGYLVAKADPGIWYKEVMRRAELAKIEGAALCTIGGLRYPTDAEIVRGGGGIITEIERAMVGVQDASDPTEQQRSQIRPDVTVLNNGDLVALQKVARQVYDDIMLGKLKRRYSAIEV